MQDIIDLIEARAKDKPAKLFLAWEPLEGPSREWSRSEFLEDIRRVAGGLARRGVRQGDRVLVHGDNSPELLLTWFACAWLGAVCVILNPKSATDELAFYAQHTDAVGIVTQAGLPGKPAGPEDGLRWRIIVDPQAPEKLDELRDTPVPRAELNPINPGCMMFTSGTSARPKAVVWSRANAFWAAQSACLAAGLTDSDVALVFLPLYHVVGLAWSILPILQAGGAIVLQPKFSASRFWNVALARQCTFASHVQFTSAALRRQPVPAQHSFRLWCNSTWWPDYEEYFNVPILGWWGMTELVAPAIMGRLGVAQQPGSIGSVVPGYALRLAGSRNNLAPGQVGEVEVYGLRGITIFSGYFNDPEATSAAFTPDGWFRTGDRMKIVDDTSIQFLERARDVIKCGGEGVSPAEVERVIREVRGVSEVAVVGRADSAMGEVGVAFVVPDRTTADDEFAQAILSICRERLAAFKVPREIRFIDSLPRAGINKIAKGELRRLAMLPALLPIRSEGRRPD